MPGTGIIVDVTLLDDSLTQLEFETPDSVKSVHGVRSIEEKAKAFVERKFGSSVKFWSWSPKRPYDEPVISAEEVGPLSFNKVDQSFVEEVEREVGMGSCAWDTVRPERICQAAVDEYLRRCVHGINGALKVQP